MSNIQRKMYNKYTVNSGQVYCKQALCRNIPCYICTGSKDYLSRRPSVRALIRVFTFSNMNTSDQANNKDNHDILDESNFESIPLLFGNQLTLNFGKIDNKCC